MGQGGAGLNRSHRCCRPSVLLGAGWEADQRRGPSSEVGRRQHSFTVAAHGQGLQKTSEPLGLLEPVLQLRSWDFLRELLLTAESPGWRTELLLRLSKAAVPSSAAARARERQGAHNST